MSTPSPPQYWAIWSTISTSLKKGEEENDLFTQDAGLDIAGWKEGEVVDEDRLADQVAVVDVHAHLDRDDDEDEAMMIIFVKKNISHCTYDYIDYGLQTR